MWPKPCHHPSLASSPRTLSLSDPKPQVLSADLEHFVQELALPEYRRLLLHILMATGGRDAFVVTPPQPQQLGFS